MRSTIVILLSAVLAASAYAQEFKAGFGKTDITPQKPTPMWGYGDRHDALSMGVRDPLHAKCLVLEAGDEKLAIVTMDVGRGPTAPMMKAIREAVAADGINHLLISGSHTHHGPVIELLDEPGKGQGKFQDAVDYAKHLQAKLTDLIKDAASNTQPARIGWNSGDVAMNRNRHDKVDPKPIDTEMTVVRVDTADGKPIALMVNYHAHPTRLPSDDLRFSADWPGEMMKNVETELDVPCMFVQGAAGDLTTQSTDETNTLETFGAAIAREAVKINQGITTQVPETPSIQGTSHEFAFPTRSDISSPASQKFLKAAFFPELVDAFMSELGDKQIHPNLTSILLNNQIFLVGVSGEYFCSHSLRLKERAEGVRVLFHGYCNGHHMYFPTIEGASQGGYGADAGVSWVPVGAGEEIMNQALIDLFTLQGKF